MHDGIAFDFGEAFVAESAFAPFNASQYANSVGSGVLEILPGIIYPCTSNAKVWAPLGSIVLDCYTIVAASLSPLFLVVTFLLLALVEPKPSSKRGGYRAPTTHGDDISYPQFSPGGAIDEGHQLLRRDPETPSTGDGRSGYFYR